MGIGTSLGAYYDDAFHQSAAQWDDKYDDNINVPQPTGDLLDVDPDKMMINKAIGKDPGNIYNEQGQIVDYATKADPSELKTMIAPIPHLEPMSGGFNEIDALAPAQVTSEPKVLYKTASPLVNITQDDIDKAISIGLAVSGGGLETKAVTAAEKIKSAALQYKDKTYEGANHGFALGDIMDKFGDVSMKDIKDGFTTTLGRFVSREEAFGLAKKQNQIDGKVLDSIPKDQDYNMLLSEDLVQY